MDYAAWMRDQASCGKSAHGIAFAGLHKPLAVSLDSLKLNSLLRTTAERLGIKSTKLYVVGSTRYGFSLRYGTVFDPRFSDLDLAVVDSDLFNQCGYSSAHVSDGPRFPELELPAWQQRSFRLMVDELSRSVTDQFAYVAIAVFPSLQALVECESSRIASFLGLPIAAAHSRPRTSGGFTPDTFDEAILSGLPRFLSDITYSPPHKASPYIVDEAKFRQAFGLSQARTRLLESLEELFSDLAGVVEVDCYLVGGSFINKDEELPRDIDLVIFYRATDTPSHEPGRALQRLSRKYLSRDVDVHFCPCDVAPWISIKVASFYTALFQSDRQVPGHARGLVLVVPGIWAALHRHPPKEDDGPRFADYC